MLPVTHLHQAPPPHTTSPRAHRDLPLLSPWAVPDWFGLMARPSLSPSCLSLFPSFPLLPARLPPCIMREGYLPLNQLTLPRSPV